MTRTSEQLDQEERQAEQALAAAKRLRRRSPRVEGLEDYPIYRRPAAVEPPSDFEVAVALMSAGKETDATDDTEAQAG